MHTFVQPVGSCLVEDFESGWLNGWYADNGEESLVTEGNVTFLAITNRTGSWSGPTISAPLSCIEGHGAGIRYTIEAKLRLVHSISGEVSNCTSGVLDRCPKLTMIFQRTSSSAYEYATLIENTAVGQDGEWITMSAFFNFYLEYPDIDTFHDVKLSLEKPGE